MHTFSKHKHFHVVLLAWTRVALAIQPLHINKHPQLPLHLIGHTGGLLTSSLLTTTFCQNGTPKYCLKLKNHKVTLNFQLFNSNSELHCWLFLPGWRSMNPLAPYQQPILVSSVYSSLCPNNLHKQVASLPMQIALGQNHITKNLQLFLFNIYIATKLLFWQHDFT